MASNGDGWLVVPSHVAEASMSIVEHEPPRELLCLTELDMMVYTLRSTQAQQQARHAPKARGGLVFLQQAAGSSLFVD